MAGLTTRGFKCALNALLIDRFFRSVSKPAIGLRASTECTQRLFKTYIIGRPQFKGEFIKSTDPVGRVSQVVGALGASVVPHEASLCVQ